jgi:S-methylmethionine-dependent homocysteine/selenocysteine methylase
MFDGRVTLLDAGMGKDLKMRGVEVPDTIWSANALLVAPEVVLDVHRENIEAGADVITTNTYGVIRGDLAKECIEDQYAALNRRAGEIALAAVRVTKRSVSIAGSLPPLNGSYRPDLVHAFDELEPQYQEQASLLAPFVDLYLCETMSNTIEARAAAAGASSVGKPILVSYTLHDELPVRLRSGETLREAVDAVAEFDPAAVLVNCCLPERITDAMPVLRELVNGHIGGYANAFSHVPDDWLLDGDKAGDGTLELRDDLEPDRYARFAAAWVAEGATIVGGCCGTVAAHTAALRHAIDSSV